MPHLDFRWLGLAVVLAAPVAWCSDHLDTNAVKLEPGADIGDLYAWTSPDGRRLNLVMAIVGARFSDRIDYVFHIDSGRTLGATSMSSTLLCRFERRARSIARSAARDAGGCPRLDAATAGRIMDEWRHTDGHAAENLLAGWKTSALVASVDLAQITGGGRLLGV